MVKGKTHDHFAKKNKRVKQIKEHHLKLVGSKKYRKRLVKLITGKYSCLQDVSMEKHYGQFIVGQHHFKDGHGCVGCRSEDSCQFRGGMIVNENRGRLSFSEPEKPVIKEKPKEKILKMADIFSGRIYCPHCTERYYGEDEIATCRSCKADFRTA